MPSLDTVGTRFESWFEIIGGGGFRGLLDTPNDREAPAFLYAEPRRILTVKADCIVQVRDVIQSRAGEVYAVGSATSAEMTDRVLYRVHRLFEMTEQRAWTRRTTETDPLTRLPKTSTLPPQDMGTVWCSIEYPNREDADRYSHIWQERVACITSALLQEGDKLGDREVIRVTTQVGLTYAELR